MSEGKALWTPGPWRAELDQGQLGGEESGFALQRVEGGGKLIAEVGNAEAALDALDEWEANARLIAAAPEMAERLSARARLMGLAWIKLAPADDAMAAALREAATDDLALLSRLEEGQ
jgi:hypothetical protein